jgi:hypothetical protein
MSSEASPDQPSTGLKATIRCTSPYWPVKRFDQGTISDALIGLAESRAAPEVFQNQIKIFVQSIVRNN